MPSARLVGTLLALALAFTAAPAAAQERVPEDESAIDQYSESLPEAGGDTTPSAGRRPASPSATRANASLPAVRAAGADSVLLSQLVTEPALGAPPESSAAARRGGGSGRPGGSAAAERGRGNADVAGSNAATSLAEGLVKGPGLFLLLAMALVLALALALAFRHRRSTG